MLRASDALACHLAERRSRVIAIGTLERHVRLLTARIGDVDMGDQRSLAVAVAGYVRGRRGDRVKPSTIRRELITLRAAGRAAWRRGDLPFPPYVASPPSSPSRKHALTPHQARVLLRRIAPDAQLFLRIALATGARIGAILDLTWDRVDLDRGIIDFRAPHPLADRRKHRAVTAIGAGLIARLRSVRRGRRERVVTLSADAIRRRFRQARKAARLPAWVTPHAMRHTVATWLLGDLGVDLTITSRFIGHRSTATTDQVYAHLTAERHLRPAATALEQLLLG